MSGSMKIAVCDDSSRDLSQIRTVLDGIKERFDLEVRYYGSGQEMIAAVENGCEPSLVILDIYMNGFDGIKTARRLKELLPKLQTAFLTSSTEFAVDAFDVGALHYIVKPVTREKILELMDRFFGRVSSAGRTIEIKSKTKTYSFPVFRVQKIVSSNKGVDVYLKKGGPVHIPESFSAVEEQLDSSLFLRISRGLSVNMSHILFMNNELCRFKDGTEVLISRKEKSDIRRRYNDYLFEGQGDNI